MRRKEPIKSPQKMFETRSHSWREAGLAHEITHRADRMARWRALGLLLLFAAVVGVFSNRVAILGGAGETKNLNDPLEGEVRAAAVLLLLALGAAIWREAGKAMRSAFYRRLHPATAGTVGFLIRLSTVISVGVIVLVVAGVKASAALAYGGAFTAVISVIVGLAAQQTLGNFFAGTVLLTARPFRVGERVRLQGGSIGGQIEGVVSSLGLLYTTLARGGDTIMIPNSVVLAVAIRPLREPDAVSLRARLTPGMTPSDVQELLEAGLKTPLRAAPRITLEELDGAQAVVQILATPKRSADGRVLASEILQLVPSGSEHPTAAEQPAGPDGANGSRRQSP